MAAENPTPLVSCIMPTHDRRRFVPLAVHYFLRQEYPHRELIVLDDGADVVDDLIPDDPRVRYLRLDRRLSIGAKRNRAVAEARGELVAHWDDDDWNGPERLQVQVERLLASGADLCGLDRPLFYDADARRAWQYRYAGRRPWAAGGTWLYRRKLWEERPFDAVDDGEDTRFVWRLASGRVLALGDAPWFVALVHPGGSSRKRFQAPRWHTRPADVATTRMGEDAEYYVGAGRVPSAAQTACAEAPEPRPCVTVAIPTFGPATHLRRAVESILAQTWRELRVVVVNDGGDPPWEALTGVDDPRLVRFDLEENRGRYFADAVVLEATPDPFFAVLDADDWSEPDRLERLIARLQDEAADVAYSASWKCVPDAPDDRWLESFAALRAPLGRDFVHRAHHPCALYSSEALRRLGGPFGGFRIGYDSLLVNLLRMTAEIAFEERPLTTYCMRPDSLTASAATGFGTAERERVWAALERVYQEARALHERHLAGAFRRETLAELIRQHIARGIDPADLQTLAREAGRLRALLGVDGLGGGVESGARRPPSAPELDAMLEDPRVRWSNWSVSKTLARTLAQHVERHRPTRILELGSGVSTLVLACAAARADATVTTLEHDPVWFGRTADLLAAFGLRDRVDLRWAPLRNREGSPWYSSPLAGRYDFVFADGPPLAVGRTAILPAIRDHLAEDWTLWLKDGHRAHERACVAGWAARYRFHQRLRDTDPRGVWELSSHQPLDVGTPVVAVAERGPLVSCLMPTRDRPSFIEQSIALFLRQDHPNCELILVDDGSEPVRDRVAVDPRITYVRLEERATTGAKRNVAAEVARGEVLVCWDDDDWYGRGRLTAQVGPVLRGEADVTALGRSLFYDLREGQFWSCTPKVHARMFFKQVVGGTLAYRRSSGVRFPDSSMAEDAALLRTLLSRGARLLPVPNEDLFVYVRHGGNSWRFPHGRYVDPRGWHRVAAPAFMPAEDVAFYRGLQRPAPDRVAT